MNTKFLRVATDDKLLLQGFLRASDTTSRKVILHIHGMAGNFYENRFLDTMASTFTSNGYDLCSPNTRGHDFIADFPIVGEEEKYKRIGTIYETFEECVYDIAAWLNYLESVGYKEIILQGHSLGAVKIAYYLSKTADTRISKLILLSPPDMVGLAEREAYHQDMMDLSKKMIEEGRGREMLPKVLWDWYLLSANTYRDFHTRDNPIDVFNVYDKDKRSVLSEIRIPVYAFFGSRDDAALLDPAEELTILKKKTTNCTRFDQEVIEGAPHSYFVHERELAEKIIS